jgi:hypothetical protein
MQALPCGEGRGGVKKTKIGAGWLLHQSQKNKKYAMNIIMKRSCFAYGLLKIY